MIYLILLHVYGHLITTIIRAGNDEPLAALMLADDLNQAGGAAVRRKKDFPLSVENEFLKVERYGFRNAEVFHILGHLNLKFLANAKKMVNGTSTTENHCGILSNIY